MQRERLFDRELQECHTYVERMNTKIIQHRLLIRSTDDEGKFKTEGNTSIHKKMSFRLFIIIIIKKPPLCGDMLISCLVSFCIVSVCACLAICCVKIRKVCPAEFYCTTHLNWPMRWEIFFFLSA